MLSRCQFPRLACRERTGGPSEAEISKKKEEANKDRPFSNPKREGGTQSKACCPQQSHSHIPGAFLCAKTGGMTSGKSSSLVVMQLAAAEKAVPADCLMLEI